jgi:hypothetical protein
MAWTCPCAALVSRLGPRSQLKLSSFRVWDISIRNWTCVCGVVWPVLIENERKANYHNSRTQCADTIAGCICTCNRACDCERVRNMRGVTHATHEATVTAAVRSLQCSDVAARARAHREL